MSYLQYLIDLDNQLLYFFYRTLHYPVAFFFFKSITNLADAIIAIAMLLFLVKLFSKKGRDKKLQDILIPVIITTIVTVVLKLLIQRAPPSHLYMHMPWPEFSPFPWRLAFPSGHASRAFALAAALGYQFRHAKIFFFIGAFLIGFSRIYIGVHFPLDVIAGALLGTFIVWFYNVKKKELIKKKQK